MNNSTQRKFLTKCKQKLQLHFVTVVVDVVSVVADAVYLSVNLARYLSVCHLCFCTRGQLKKLSISVSPAFRFTTVYFVLLIFWYGSDVGWVKQGEIRGFWEIDSFNSFYFLDFLEEFFVGCGSISFLPIAISSNSAQSMKLSVCPSGNIDQKIVSG